MLLQPTLFNDFTKVEVHLKRYAPQVFHKYASKKVIALQVKLNLLKYKLQTETDPKIIDDYNDEIDSLNRQLEFYK